MDSASTTAPLLRDDSTTSGNWIGAYGTQGYDILAGASSLPSYATITPSGASSYTWSTTSTDSRALQTPGSSNRVAACWYSTTSFSVDVNLTDGQQHLLSIYALDFDSLGRSEQVQILSATTGAVLDTETISSFSGGVYLQWQVSGNVVIQFTRESGPNALVNGIFLDSSPAAGYVKEDTATQGNWIGAYGAQGYEIAAGASSLPSYATITPSGATSYIWSTTSSDARALQTPGSSNRVAACWFSATSFSVDVNLTDGQQHLLSIYALDFDSKGRDEQIQILSAATGAVLDTETISSFSGGVYLQWKVSGDIVVKVTNLAGTSTNALISGLFLDAPTSSGTAAFVKQDTTTQGNWIGAYGNQGYDVINNGSSLPSYASISAVGASNYTWPSTTDPRALQDAVGSGRIAACWYSATSFSVDVNLSDGQQHLLSIYALDFDKLGRSEEIQILSTSGTVLDTETLSSFTGGVYLQWEVSGDIVVKVTRLGGNNALINGLFLDAPTSSGTASFVKQDTTTQGNWIGAYGNQGYDVINNGSSLPSYASISAAGESSYTWPSTTDPRALQDAVGSGRIAACWFSATSFSVGVNLTDGQQHLLSIYALDYDNKGRERADPDPQHVGHGAGHRDDLVVQRRGVPAVEGERRHRGQGDQPGRYSTTP